MTDTGSYRAGSARQASDHLRALWILLLLSALSVSACVEAGISSRDLEMAPDADVAPSPEMAPDSEPEMAPDAAPDMTPDAAPEMTPDAAPDMAPDATPDMTPEMSPDPEPSPARYPDDALISPFNPFVAQRLQSIRDLNDSPDDLVFMKVGASGTVSQNLLYCLSGDPDSGHLVDLDGRQALGDTVEYFRMGDAAGSTPFDRASQAARVGQSARWAITGDPSPMESEIAAINPRFALVNYGTNDMQLGTTHLSALSPFYENFTSLLEQLLNQGIIPLVFGLNPRTDSASGAAWVPTYNAVTRGVAEALQIPFINLYLGTVGLENQGLVGDGVHGNVYRSGGRAQPCVFTQQGLAYNYNVRNLLSLEALHAARLVTLEGARASDQAETIRGSGSPQDPFIIDRLPFTHAASTAGSPHRSIDAYPACDSGQDESGPELFYRLELSAPATVRIIVLDRGATDIDLHLLSGGPEAAACVDRDDKSIERRLEAGVWTLSLDTFVGSGGTVNAGDYLLTIVEP